ncbi:MAG: hypothetical protein R3B47_18730 [Bacteroidia bacterium]
MLTFRKFFIFLLIVGFSPFVFGQTGGKLFDSEEMLSIRLEFDVAKLQKYRERNPTWLDTDLRFLLANGDTAEMKVQVKARGHFRRLGETCTLPPLRIRFSQNDTIDPFYPDTKLKLVTICQEENYNFREYMVYRLYQELSEYSLRARLCKVEYVDKNNAVPSLTASGFFIEEVDRLAKRKNATEIDTSDYSLNDMHREQLTLVHMFQYMIGNPDHHPDRMQNTKLIQPDDGSPAIPVPYDFDWSGMVDASYTKLEGFSGGLFDKRRFVPIDRSIEEFEATATIFIQKRERMESLIREADYLTAEDKKHMLDYMASFFDVIEKKGKMKKEFMK